ncbi:MAG TPA: hypothetical protein VF541_03260 [Longimicrobium sp.]
MKTTTCMLLSTAALLLPARAVLAQDEVVVDAAVVAGLQPRLDRFAASLSPAGQAIWAEVLDRATAAPADDPAGTTVAAVRYGGMQFAAGAGSRRTSGNVAAPRDTHTGQAAGRAAQGGIILQNPGQQQGIVVQGGRTAQQGIVVQGGIIVQGGRTASDPDARAFNDQLAAFAATLSPQEQAAVDWLMDRAGRGAMSTPSDRRLGHALAGEHGAVRTHRVKFRP